jgi:signal transduction histidine kinase
VTEGTGLGLPLVKTMIEMHGGTLEIESEINAGTTVTINFPSDRFVNDRAERVA